MQAVLIKGACKNYSKKVELNNDLNNLKIWNEDQFMH